MARLFLEILSFANQTINDGLVYVSKTKRVLSLTQIL